MPWGNWRGDTIIKERITALAPYSGLSRMLALPASENMTPYASSASTREGSPLLVRRFEPSASPTEITLAIERCKRLSISRFVYVSTGMLILNRHQGFRVAGGSSRRSQPQGALTFSTSQTSCCLRLRGHDLWLVWRDKEFQGFLARERGSWLRRVSFDGIRSESLGRCDQGAGLGPLRLGAPRAGPARRPLLG